MDATIIEFLVGVVAGTVSSLLIVKRAGKTQQRRTMHNVRLGTSRSSARTLPRQVKTRHVRSRRLRSRLAGNKAIPTGAILETSNSQVAPQTTMLSCPACGLEAPGSLMAEHFLGSPSHENGASKVQPIIADTELRQQTDDISSEKDSGDSLRNLLQMLVPPRAFGRRHDQRTVNPLSSLVQTIGAPRNNTVQ